jgi:hypothetical protein
MKPDERPVTQFEPVIIGWAHNEEPVDDLLHRHFKELALGDACSVAVEAVRLYNLMLLGDGDPVGDDDPEDWLMYAAVCAGNGVGCGEIARILGCREEVIESIVEDGSDLKDAAGADALMKEIAKRTKVYEAIEEGR